MNDIIVVKCGGSTIDHLSKSFFQSIKDLKDSGKSPIIVHGGGPEINKMLQTLHVESHFINGLRKTTKEVLETAEMVLCGKVNKKLVTEFHKVGLNAIGLSGCDGKLLEVVPVNIEKLGFVGEVANMNTELLQQLVQSHFTPIIAPIGIGNDGERYNINADSAAAAVATTLGAKELLFVTDVPGILRHERLLERVTTEEVKELIDNGTISGGMIPKVLAAMKSLKGNIESVKIMNGQGNHLIKNGSMIGTMIVKGSTPKHVI
ncbi:acetylglutamate kinase [Evansella halocellulosilytica]|uniref:acetylglutamate kinase n=1 Tax=Evansella halocellulosilytica TaxID=2011013 RepID=UPI000BB71D02|nr:acetylglutamate kinase [Evansella halocellulosilytica]